MDQLLKQVDPEIFEAIQGERNREMDRLELIASENFVTEAVYEALRSAMTNKYAEGYPGKRYYGGCEFVDQAEELARNRACALFGADHANVQPHSGTQANMGVYFAVLEPGDTVLGMDLSHGGHLSHGHPVNFSGRLYNFLRYGVDRESERIDLDQVRDLTREHRPKMIMVGASAYPRTIDFKPFREIADEVGAVVVADIAHIAGMVAAGIHPNPTPHVEFVTSTTHKTLRGPRGGIVMCREELAKDIDRAIFPGLQGGPLMHVIAAKAVCFHLAAQPSFKEYQEQVVRNAARLAAGLQEQGLRLVSGGTDNHLLLVDMTPVGMSGKKAERLLEAAGITVNKNTIPFDTRKPFVTSGIRIGTPAVTTRGMKEAEMDHIAEWIGRVLKNPDDEPITQQVRAEVLELCKEHPVYTGL